MGRSYTVKKVSDFPGMSLTKLSLAMSLTDLSLASKTVTKLFPTRESLVSDIPAGDGKIANLFYSVLALQPARTVTTTHG
jgi:hypothetical protein